MCFLNIKSSEPIVVVTQIMNRKSSIVCLLYTKKRVDVNGVKKCYNFPILDIVRKRITVSKF